MFSTPLAVALVAIYSLFFPTAPSLTASTDIAVEEGITITDNITATVERRLGDAVEADNLTIYEIGERPDADDVLADVVAGEAETVLVVKDVFTTINGSWAAGGDPHNAPSWAAPDYRVGSFDDSDKSRIFFAAVLDAEGNLLREEPLVFWSDGVARLGDAGYGGFYETRTKFSSGWANSGLASSSVYDPDAGLAGPWCATLGSGADSAAEVLCGVGLPNDLNVSTFVVWQEVTVERSSDSPDDDDGDDESGEGDNDDGEGEGDDEGGDDEGGDDRDDDSGDDDSGDDDSGNDDESNGTIPALERRTSDWFEPLNLTIHALDERPDAEETSVPGDIVYLIKDVWTTRDGSWEPSDARGAAPTWAREEYLRPIGAPDYFDDAGGDHHLFAAVIGLDDEYVRSQEILYWSDGLAMLGEEAYDSYTVRETKQGSGWINIPIGPGSSYVPERDEAGPWCWTLGEGAVGVAEVFCGGGLPANQHVSTFVVWQAVELVDNGGGSTLPEFEVTDSVYLPLVTAR